MKVFVRTILSLLFALMLTAVASAASPSPSDLLLAGRVDDAVRALTAKIQSAPNDAEAHHLLSRAYYHLKNWDQSVNYGEKAVQLAPNRSDYFMWLARAYGGKADDSNPFSAARLVGKIRGNFQRAVELDPKNLDARTDLAEFYVEAPGFMGGGTDKAAAEAQKIAQTDQARSHWVLARIADKKKDSATAEREYLESVKASPSADYYNNLAAFYKKSNRWSDFDNAINKAAAAEKRKSSDDYDSASLLYEANRNLPNAAKLLRRYLASNATNEEAPAFMAHLLLGNVLEKSGDRAGAANEYRATISLASSYGPAQEALKRVSQ
jgi:tetratricopeptide (TPR) repeat protein